MTLTQLADLYNTDKGTLPGEHGHPHRYAEIYETFFAPLREKKLNIVEIGVYKGASLKLWEAYFPQAKIVAIDINPSCAHYATDRSTIEIGDAGDANFLNQVIHKHFANEPIDIVIDDGSHRLHHQITSVVTLFPHLAEQGLFFIEDICASRFFINESPMFDFLDFSNFLAEQMIFFTDTSSPYYHSITDTRKLAQTPEYNYFNKNLFSVQLYHDLCLLIKKKRIFPYAAAMDYTENDLTKLTPNEMKTAKYRQLENENTLLKNKLAKQMNSRSWRLTQPLRWLKHKIFS